VNVSRSWLLEVANVLNCRVSSLPIMYLCLPLGEGGGLSPIEFLGFSCQSYQISFVQLEE